MAPGKVAIPPALPPTVEEAYRRKCMELKQRSKEVEDVNDATKLRISRLKRQVDKLRVERALLLEQIAKRTSANVEDSDGSPSPPPTPKEKPLRIKRGHRQPSILQNFEANPIAGSTFINQNLATLSPSSDAFSHHVEHKDGHHKDLPSSRSHPDPATNGLSSKPKKPKTAFEAWADTVRDELKSKQDKQEQAQDDDDTPAAPANIEEELANRWKDLPDEDKKPFEDLERAELEKYRKEKEEASKEGAGEADDKAGEVDTEAHTENGSKSANDDKDDKDVKDEPDVDDEDAANDKSPTREPTKRAPQDEDVEMANYDSDIGDAES